MACLHRMYFKNERVQKVFKAKKQVKECINDLSTRIQQSPSMDGDFPNALGS